MNQESKEDFCGACMAVPLAFAGAGVAAYGATSRSQHRRRKKMILWTGLLTVVISILVIIYYMKTCSECA